MSRVAGTNFTNSWLDALISAEERLGFVHVRRLEFRMYNKARLFMSSAAGTSTTTRPLLARHPIVVAMKQQQQQQQPQPQRSRSLITSTSISLAAQAHQRSVFCSCSSPTLLRAQSSSTTAERVGWWCGRLLVTRDIVAVGDFPIARRRIHLSSRMPNIINDIKLDFKDVLLRPKRSTLKSRSDVDLYREITFRNSKQTYSGIPVMASNMDTVGTFEMARALSKHGLFTTVHKYYSAEDWKEFASKNPDCLKNMAASSGTGDDDFQRLSSVLAAIPELSFICIDVANGYSQHFVEYVRKVRAEFPKHTIIAGNVVTGEMVEELILSGADIIKVGIGPGSVCTTRMKTGVGYPQLSAVIECADAAHGLKGHIISDGGCICPGDIAKAFGAGADFVMAGGMFAGHDECGGNIIEKDGKKFKLFYGMASSTAMKKHAGGVADYRSSEGKTVEVPYKGPVEATVLDMLGGLRSACTYVGASRLRELPRRATFIRCTQQLNNIFGSPM